MVTKKSAEVETDPTVGFKLSLNHRMLKWSLKNKWKNEDQFQLCLFFFFISVFPKKNFTWEIH